MFLHILVNLIFFLRAVNRYLYRQLVEIGDDRYGFLCPHKMNLKAGNITRQNVSEYIQKTLAATNKEIYLAPFCHRYVN